MAEGTEHTNVPRRIVEELIDVLVFAPVGLASTVVEELPALVEKGRNRLTVARTIGQFAVVMGRQRINQAMSDRSSRPASPEEPPTGQDVGADDEDDDGDDYQAPAHHGGAGGERSGAPDLDPGGLAIPGYDSLAASQVVQRLAGLSPEELEAVRQYEEATRGRRTILGRISQLSGTRSEPEQE